MGSDIIERFPDTAALAGAAARRFVDVARAAVEARGLFTVALSGGSTPKDLYTLLACDAGFRAAVPWEKTHFFFGDERHLPPGHAESNYRMANEAMFMHLTAGQLHVHRIEGERQDADEAASLYEAELKTFFAQAGRLVAGIPRFDLILLGMGADGHTASLFPGTQALAEDVRWVAANRVPQLKTDRITLTFPVLNNAAEVILLVAGDNKRVVLNEILQGSGSAAKYPVQLVRPRDGVKRWMLALPQGGSGSDGYCF